MYEGRDKLIHRTNIGLNRTQNTLPNPHLPSSSQTLWERTTVSSINFFRTSSSISAIIWQWHFYFLWNNLQFLSVQIWNTIVADQFVNKVMQRLRPPCSSRHPNKPITISPESSAVAHTLKLQQNTLTKIMWYWTKGPSQKAQAAWFWACHTCKLSWDRSLPRTTSQRGKE